MGWNRRQGDIKYRRHMHRLSKHADLGRKPKDFEMVNIEKSEVIVTNVPQTSIVFATSDKTGTFIRKDDNSTVFITTGETYLMEKEN